MSCEAAAMIPRTLKGSTRLGGENPFGDGRAQSIPQRKITGSLFKTKTKKEFFRQKTAAGQ